MIDDPDDYCPASVYREHGHSLWRVARCRYPWARLIPERWRYVWRCLYCRERAR